MSMKNRARAMMSTAIACAAALLLAAGGASTATAQPATNPLIEPERTADVTIHAIEQDADVGMPADGRQDSALDGAEGIPGLTFTAKKIDSVSLQGTRHSLDLTTNEGWLNASLLEFDPRSGLWTFDGNSTDVVESATRVYTAETGPADGEYRPAKMTDMAVGLYLFEETEAPVDVTRSLPWMMTVPLTDPVELDSWNYDIHVYPKNTTTALTKTVDDGQSKSTADIVEWTITADIPLVADPHSDRPETKFFPPELYVITDELDPRLVPAGAPAAEPKLIGTNMSLDSLDYTIAWNNDGSNQSLRFELTEQGRTKAGQAVSRTERPEDVKVQLSVKTRVRTYSSGAERGTVGDGLIDNQAHLYLDHQAITRNRPIESDEPLTKWGDILIEKVDATNPNKKLGGATFAVFASEDDARARRNALEVGGEEEFTTGADGTARISGLRYSDWAENSLVEPGQEQTYWIVELKAPTGYELLAEPIEIHVTDLQQSVDTATRVRNAPHNSSFELPLTGAAGTWIFTAAGVLLVGGGALLAVCRKSGDKAAK